MPRETLYAHWLLNTADPFVVLMPGGLAHVGFKCKYQAFDFAATKSFEFGLPLRVVRRVPKLRSVRIGPVPASPQENNFMAPYEELDRRE